MFVAAGGVRGDEAFARDGRRFSGTIDWTATPPTFVAGPKIAVPLTSFARVRVDGSKSAPARGAWTHRLLLAGSQEITGEFVAFDGADVRFRTSWGMAATLPRAVVRGVVQTGDDLLLARKACDPAGVGWTFSPGWKAIQGPEGTKGMAAQGTPCEAILRVDAGPNAGRIVCLVSAVQAEGVVEATFGRGQGAATERIAFRQGGVSFAEEPSVALDGGAWRILELRFGDGVVRAFVDDLFLGERRFDAKGTTTGFRIATTDKHRGTFAIADWTLRRSAPTVARTFSDPKLDEVQQAAGEQTFGKIVGADAEGIRLETRLGPLTFPWSAARGFHLAGTPVSTPAWRIAFKAAPGGTIDALEAAFLGVDKEAGIFRHPQLGRVAIPLGSIAEIRFAANP